VGGVLSGVGLRCEGGIHKFGCGGSVVWCRVVGGGFWVCVTRVAGCFVAWGLLWEEGGAG